jgi:GAF domain-containing protein
VRGAADITSPSKRRQYRFPAPAGAKTGPVPVSHLEARLDAALDADLPFPEMVRSLLALVSEATGLSTTYLARAHMREDEQEILFSHNAQDDLHVPEDIKLPWSEGVCSFVHDGKAPEFTDNVPRDIPGSTVARMLGYRSFLSLPVFRHGQFYGTLCGCSARPIKVSPATLELIRKCASRIGELLPEDAE